MPDAFPTVALGGPQWRRLYALPPEYAAIKGPVYVDGGQDTFLSTTTPVRRWVIDYETLTVTEAEILDDHFASTYGAHLSFSFTDPHTGDVYAGVRYENFERPAHNRLAIQARRVQLIKRP